MPQDESTSTSTSIGAIGLAGPHKMSFAWRCRRSYEIYSIPRTFSEQTGPTTLTVSNTSKVRPIEFLVLLWYDLYLCCGTVVLTEGGIVYLRKPQTGKPSAYVTKAANIIGCSWRQLSALSSSW